MKNKEKYQFFRNNLITWYHSHQRNLPWRQNKNPYSIWLSEIMLQQTTVKTVIPYFQNFLKTFPNLSSVAKSKEEDLLKAWAGLGYYSRVRNFKKAAQILISQQRKIPDNKMELMTLPGLGDYTASAIASIAFGEPVAVVDGNVLRVLSRLFRMKNDISKDKTIFSELAQELLDEKNPGDYNQAIMELGATVCTPQNPTCLFCPVSKFCEAFKHTDVDQYPVKSKKMKLTAHKIDALIFEHKNSYLMRQRKSGEIMEGLWEFPLHCEEKTAPEKIVQQLPSTLKYDRNKSLKSVSHTIMSYKMKITPWMIKQNNKINCDGYTWVKKEKLDSYPLSTISKKIIMSFPLPTR